MSATDIFNYFTIKERLRQCNNQHRNNCSNLLVIFYVVIDLRFKVLMDFFCFSSMRVLVRVWVDLQ